MSNTFRVFCSAEFGRATVTSGKAKTCFKFGASPVILTSGEAKILLELGPGKIVQLYPDVR